MARYVIHVSEEPESKGAGCGTIIFWLGILFFAAMVFGSGR